MGDTPAETVPCHYCGADIEVPADRSRFEAFTTHFQTEHIRNRFAVPGEQRDADVSRDPTGTMEGAQDAGN